MQRGRRRRNGPILEDSAALQGQPRSVWRYRSSVSGSAEALSHGASGSRPWSTCQTRSRSATIDRAASTAAPVGSAAAAVSQSASDPSWSGRQIAGCTERHLRVGVVQRASMPAEIFGSRRVVMRTIRRLPFLDVRVFGPRRDQSPNAVSIRLFAGNQCHQPVKPATWRSSFGSPPLLVIRQSRRTADHDQGVAHLLAARVLGRGSAIKSSVTSGPNCQMREVSQVAGSFLSSADIAPIYDRISLRKDSFVGANWRR